MSAKITLIIIFYLSLIFSNSIFSAKQETKNIKPSPKRLLINNNKSGMFNISIQNSKFSAKPTIENSTDGVFNITLEANPTTGYQWFLEQYDSKLLNLINYSFLPDNTDKKLMGAPGRAKWTFRINSYMVKAPVMTKISLVHTRSFENNHANDSKETLTVYIQPK